MRCCKDIANLLIWELWECLIMLIKIILSICRKLSFWSACKKSTSSLNYFPRYFKEIANLLLWVIWAFLVTHTKNDNSNLRKPVKFICRWNIKFILHVFLEILQRFCKLVVLGTLGMPGYASIKWYYQLVENFCVYLQAKNQVHPLCFSGDIAKICELLILSTLGMPGCVHPNW